MIAPTFNAILIIVQHIIALAGILVILSGIIVAIVQYCHFLYRGNLTKKAVDINVVRSNLGRVLILGLEFIVAADLIGTMSAPDYYSVGIVACIVAIRTVLSYTINREITNLNKE